MTTKQMTVCYDDQVSNNTVYMLLQTHNLPPIQQGKIRPVRATLGSKLSPITTGKTNEAVYVSYTANAILTTANSKPSVKQNMKFINHIHNDEQNKPK